MPTVEPPTVPPDAELVDWYHAGHTALLEALRAAPPDLECFTFLPAPSQLAFWARRQALETAIHRADAEGAAGSVSPYDDALALDGMSELLVGFGARKKEFEPGTLRLEPHGGPSWLVSLGPVGMTATAEGPGTPADATVTGSPSDVYRWMWNRPADVSVTGSAAVAKQWQKIQIRWS
jgi:uncharacterized protein (TIGR03083 family)